MVYTQTGQCRHGLWGKAMLLKRCAHLRRNEVEQALHAFVGLLESCSSGPSHVPARFYDACCCWLQTTLKEV